MRGKGKAAVRCRHHGLIAAVGLWLGAVPLNAGGHHSSPAPARMPETPLAAAAARAGIDQPTPAPTPIPALPAATPELAPPQAPAHSVVVAVHDPSAIEHFTPDARRVREMVDRLVMAVTGRDSVGGAWRSLVEPKDIVGIKISATGHASGATHRAVVEAIVEGLREAGVPMGNVLVWDREADDLRAAGYLDAAGRSTLACAVSGIAPRRGYDPADTYTSPVLGKLIWGDLAFQGQTVPADDLRADGVMFMSDPLSGGRSAQPTTSGNAKLLDALARQNLSNVSHYCTILSRRVTKIINVPVFADNYFAGLGGALYNVTIPDMDNWRRLVGAPRYGVTAIPEIFSDPQLGGKVVLNITDGLVAQIAGGPYFQPLYARPHGTLYASRDAVALDSVVLRQLEGWRVQAQLPALKDAAAHVKTAGDMGLGNYAAEKIDLHTLGP